MAFSTSSQVDWLSGIATMSAIGYGELEQEREHRVSYHTTQRESLRPGQLLFDRVVRPWLDKKRCFGSFTGMPRARTRVVESTSKTSIFLQGRQLRQLEDNLCLVHLKQRNIFGRAESECGGLGSRKEAVDEMVCCSLQMFH
jgi:hypothetical protein